MTTPTPRPVTPTRYRTNVALYVATVLAVCGVVLLGVLVTRAEPWTDDAAAAGATVPDEETRLYQDVLQAATDQATAFVNIDYQELDASIETVRKGATGTFRDQYDASVDGLRELMTRNKSVMTGEVLSAGVVAADEDSATVLVATRGHVENTQTKGEKQERNLRLQLELSKVKGTWLTSDLQFVG